MEDYLTEDDQWEALKRWLKENGAWIIGGVVLGAGLLLAYRWWNSHVTERAEDASVQYAQVQAALAEKKADRAKELAGDLTKDYSHTPYADHAQLALVRTEVESGQLDKAAERLKALADNSDDEYLKQVARIRLARVQLAQQKPDDALATLNKVKTGAFSGLVNEVRGDALLAKGDRSGALDAYKAAMLEMGGNSIEGSPLQLKITDLASVPAAQPAPAPAEPATKDAKK